MGTPNLNWDENRKHIMRRKGLRGAPRWTSHNTSEAMSYKKQTREEIELAMKDWKKEIERVPTGEPITFSNPHL